MSLHVYAVFDHQSGELVAIHSSLVGAGASAIAHLGGDLTLDGGAPLDVDDLHQALAGELAVVLRTSASPTASVRVERRLLGT